MNKVINDLEAFEVERSGINISGCSPYPDKLKEFKIKCINHVLDYKNRCEETIDAMNKAVNDCLESLNLLKK